MIYLFTATSSQASIYKAVNYQAKLLDKATGIPVANGSYDVKLSIYDDPAAGNRLWTARGTVGTPTAKSVTVTNGIFSTMLGESGDNAISLDFSTDSYYLGVTVGADAEMTPRKRIGAVPQAFNANGLIGDGLINITGAPTGTGVGQGTVYINPASTTDEWTLLGIAVGGSQKLRIDEDGDLSIAGALSLGGLSSLTAGSESGYAAYQTGDGAPRAFLKNTGYLEFGPGGVAVTDTNLYRSTADYLATDDGLSVAGNLGVGITNPSHKLHIVDTDNTASRSALYVSQTAAITGTGYAGYLSKTGGSTTNVGLYVTASGATNNYGLIVGSGFVGMGVTNPTNALAVVANDATAYTNWPNGDGTYGYSVDTFDALFAKNTGSSSNGDITSILLQTYNASDSTQYKAARIGLLKTDATNQSALAFALRLPGSDSMGEFMRITNSGYVGIGTTAPHSTLHVGGSYAVGYVAKTAAYTAGDSDSMISVDTTSGNVSIYLPSATTITGRIYTIKKIVAANTVTVDPSGAQTIDGSSTATLSSQWSYITVISDGANWLKIADG
ncbi:hypothetical protein A2215_02410 [Candidatus Berkelbacteria bacterium RIFOXYA2_FULL_43_10]|uniref:Uncharacterized protein n=1 Tax=Candidatus Berkelbacteria bacterium RIFOXYA2_FULL_43_10 TaxID=1797472 RepID=A0A1F5ECK3_9BACT|nr:MAG: hypothetical protein A2215_02410 [Candidatus Berkelbacteria bacterium RIFOXYA2_FULL_43_10]